MGKQCIKTYYVFLCIEATIGFTEDVYETAENAGKARVGVRFLSGGADVPVTVG